MSSFLNRMRSSTNLSSKDSPPGSPSHSRPLSKSPLGGSSSTVLADPGNEDDHLIVDYRETKKPILECFSKMEGDRERINVIREIYTSEIAYLMGLTKLVLVCYKPLKSLGIKSPFSEPEKASLFSNAEVIRLLHLKFLRQMDQKFREWTPESLISDLFIGASPFFTEEYMVYCKNHDAANTLFEQISSRPKVQSFIKKTLPHADGQPIPALLILPVQRIPRYELLIRDLLKKTPEEHPDFAGLQAAAEKIRELSNKINEGIRAHQKAQAFTDVKSISGIEDLQNNQERFLYECSYNVVGIDLGYAIDEATHHKLKQEYGTAARILLFNNILIYTKKEDSKKKKNDKSSKEKISTAQGVAGKRFFLHTLWVDSQEEERFKLTLMAPELRIHLEAGSVLDKNQSVQFIQEAISIWCQARPNLSRVVDGTTYRVFNHNFNDGRKYKGDWQNCQPFGQGRISYPNGNVYEGGNENLVLCGEGKMVYIDGFVYEGRWRDNLPSGRGALSHSNRCVSYAGDWLEGLPDGSGEISWAFSGDSYCGQWRSGRPHGEGLYYFADGSHYFGNWADGLWDGKGTYTSATGGVYVGDLVRMLRDGQGKAVYANGDVYIGGWSGDQRSGTGRLTFAGQRGFCEGEWKEDALHGWARLELTNGVRYEGEWVRGQRSGAGKQHYPNGTTYEGAWVSDRRMGDGTYQHPNGARYVGSFHSDLPFGDGQFVEADGARFEGKWVKGARTGPGTQLYANGDSYSGDWKNNRRTGKGAYTRKTADGVAIRYEGGWENDRIFGSGVLTVGPLHYEGDFSHEMPHGAGAETISFLGVLLRGTWESGLRHGVFSFQKESAPPSTQIWNQNRFIYHPTESAPASSADSSAATQSLFLGPIDKVLAHSKGSSTTGPLPYALFQPVLPWPLFSSPHGNDPTSLSSFC